MENENADLKQKLNYLYVQGDHNDRSIETLKIWNKNVSLILDEIRFAQNVSIIQQLQKSDQPPSDCRAVHDNGERTSGVYSINPWSELSDKSVQVFCDMTTAGGGWTFIQNRIDGKVNFSRSWQDYKVGFGDVSTSYWIGNDVIHQLTKDNSSSLYVSITDKDGTTHYVQYDTFSISGEDDDYRLYIAGKASGTLEDRMRNTTSQVDRNNINMMKFSTYDKDNDLSTNCVNDMGMGGGWWFNACSDAFLNGQYPPGKWSQPWHPRFSDAKQISTTRMMIKRQ